jgi:hypothetical protein
MEFLRAKGLDSNPNVVLRRTNKKPLMQVRSAWRKLQEQEKNRFLNAASIGKIIDSMYTQIFDLPKEEGPVKNDETSKVVGTLHESCDEFPCFGGPLNRSSSK